MKKYSYSGPVHSFGLIVSNLWSGETMATSEKKALSNLMYQYKKQHKILPESKITLDSRYLVEL